MEYFSNNIDEYDNVVDRVLIYEYDDPGLKVDSGSFIFSEEKERYDYTVEACDVSVKTLALTKI